MRITRREALGTLAAPVLGAAPPTAASPKRPRAFRHSDVVFGFAFTPEEYKMWGGTVVFGWTGGPRRKEDVPKFVARQEAALTVGARMGASINGFATHHGSGLDWYRERDPDWRDGLWRDLSGNLLVEPWLSPPDPFPPERGRMCSNHPLYREMKLWQTDLAIAVQPFAFHVDDPLATATVLRKSACFCKHCTAAFREYVRTRVRPEATRSAAIGDLDGFDYGAFLRGRSDKPLWYEFENFQLRRAVENLKAIAAYARKKRGAWIPVGANAPAVGPHIVFAPHLDYICAEVGTDAKQMKFGAKPLLNYKMADAFSLAVAATGIYQDWVMLWQHDIPDLVRGWVAESYALGGNFIVPHKEWGFVQEPGQDPRNIAYPGKVELIGPLYKFVRDHSDLLDGYEAVRQVALLYDYRAQRTGSGRRDKAAPLDSICLALADANIQFGMAVAGDEPLDHEVRAGDLGPGELLIVNGPVLAQGRQRKLLDEWERQGRVLRWDGSGKVLDRVARLVRSEPEGGEVWVLPRVPADPTGPLVCHVLNRVFDPKAERLARRANVRVVLSKRLFGARPYGKCTMFMERQSPLALPVKARGEFVEVSIPELELWAVLRFS